MNYGHLLSTFDYIVIISVMIIYLFQVVMAKVDTFLDCLINYDKENIHPEIIKAIQPYLKDSEFEPEFVRSKSAAAAGMLMNWI